MIQKTLVDGICFHGKSEQFYEAKLFVVFVKNKKISLFFWRIARPIYGNF